MSKAQVVLLRQLEVPSSHMKWVVGMLYKILVMLNVSINGGSTLFQSLSSSRTKIWSEQILRSKLEGTCKQPWREDCILLVLLLLHRADLIWPRIHTVHILLLGVRFS